MSETPARNIALAAVAALVMVLGITLAPGPRQEQFERTFAPVVAQYHRELASLVPREGMEIAGAHVRRKVLAIEIDPDGKAQLSEVQRRLARTLVANNVDEVKSIAWVKVTQTKVGVYVSSKTPKAYDTLGRQFVPAGSGSTPALRCSLDVTLIDPVSKKVTAFRRFEGPMPPETIGSNTHFVACPREEAADWIGMLPATK